MCRKYVKARPGQARLVPVLTVKRSQIGVMSVGATKCQIIHNLYDGAMIVNLSVGVYQI